MGKFFNSFREYRKNKQALNIQYSIMNSDYQTIDDVRIVFTFAEQAGNDKFNWDDQAVISLNLSEVFGLISTMEDINKDNVPDYNYWKTYHPKDNVNKNLILSKKGKYILLLYNDGKHTLSISFEVGSQVSQFIEKIKLIIYAGTKI